MKKTILFSLAFFCILTINAQTSSDNGDGTFRNPVIYADAPDPSIIRAGNAFYMVSTTMHYSPGCTIMKSYDLVNWEVVNYAYDFLDKRDGFSLKNGQNDYASGSWAANIRYDKYEQRFYVIVTCNSTGKSYIFSTADIENGPWHRSVVAKCYDPGFLFVDTGTECLKYIVNPSEDMGRHESYLRSFTVDANHNVTLSEATVIIDYANLENPAEGLRAEGYHGFKVGDYYYIFMIQGVGWQRQEIVWRSTSLAPGSFEGRLVFAGDIINTAGQKPMPFSGIAQGGIVDTEDGKWYALLFQDYGAVGRIPVLLPMEWEDGWPVIGNNGQSVNEILEKPVQGYPEKSIVLSDNFDNGATRKIFSDKDANTGITAGITWEQLNVLKQNGTISTAVEANEYGYNGSNLNIVWQWNHNPNNNLWSLTEREGFLRLKSGIISPNIQQARNTLTQRTFGPVCAANAAMETARMNNGDIAGLSSFQNQYGFVGVKMENGNKYIVMQRAQQKDDANGIEVESVPLSQNRVYLKVDCDFLNKTDKAYFYYSLDGQQWTRIGDCLQMAFDWPHFVGQRFGLFYYSTQNLGGCVDFDYFNVDKEITVIPRNPYVQNEAEDFVEQSGGIVIENCGEGGLNICDANNGEWIRAGIVDFGSGAASFSARVASATNGGKLELRIGSSPTGKIVGSCQVSNTGGWQNWVTVTATELQTEQLTGEQNLYLRFMGGGGVLFNMNWWQFTSLNNALPDINSQSPVYIVSQGNRKYLKGTQPGDIVTLFNSIGQKLSTFTAASDMEAMDGLKGFFFVEIKSGNQRYVLKTIL
jgi:arabinoxylan arabinofuranohydrolase